MTTKRKLIAENEQLKAKIRDLESELSSIKSELTFMETRYYIAKIDGTLSQCQRMMEERIEYLDKEAQNG